MLRLHVGQAGGQIGAQLAGLTGMPPSGEGHGCVFVDSEPKVVAPLCAESGSGRIPWLPPSAVVYDHNGRGNNWAWGYSNVASRLGGAPDAASGGGMSGRQVGGASGSAKKPLLERAMDAVRLHVSCWLAPQGAVRGAGWVG